MKKILVLILLSTSVVMVFSQANLLEKQGYAWENETWNLGSKEVYTYNEDQVLESVSGYVLDASDNWILYFDAEYQYNGDNVLESKTTTYYSGWIQATYREFIYTDGSLTQINESYRETENGSWIWDTRIFVNYSETTGLKDNEESEHHFSWGWTPEMRQDYIYDGDLLIKKERFDHMLGRITNQNVYVYNEDYLTEEYYENIDSDANISNNLKYTYLYDLSASNPTVEKKQELEIYPNPASNFVYLRNTKGLDVFIYDALGKLWYQNKIDANVFKIDVSNWPKGVYFTKVHDGLEITSSKLLLQ